MTNNNPSGKSKSRQKLRLARLPTKPVVRLRLGGNEPAHDMQPGEYKVCCEGASKKQLGDGVRIELKFRVIEGSHAGTALRQWMKVDLSGVISQRSRYAQQSVVALGRPLEPDDNLDNPASIFSGRIFRADVGFRKTEKHKGGRIDPAYAQQRKDTSDGLRVHELLCSEDL